MHQRSLTRPLTVLAALAIAITARSAHADPDAPVVISQPMVGESFSPGFRQISDLSTPYVEEEYFIQGTADLFSYLTDPPAPQDKEEIETGVPYGTRFIVRRPADAKDFNGTLVIEWFNSTVGFDTAPVWDASAEYFDREGIAYVGFTNANQALFYLLVGCPQLGTFEPQCAGRYQPPNVFPLADDGLAYEIASQLGNLLKGDAPNNPLPEDFVVERLFHAGNSQQGGSVTTYANEFHQPDLNDGYFIQVAGGGSRRLSADSPTYPPGDPNGFAPDDLPVPVIRAQSENDVERRALQTGDATFTRQDDTPTFRYYELAGVAHNPVHKDIEVIAANALFPGSPAILLEDVCALEPNTSADGPVFGSYLYNAMWENLAMQASFGIEMPSAPPLDVAGGQIARDAFGNALGGLRLPTLDVPIATYVPINAPNPALPPLPPPLDQLQNLVCLLNGGVIPFDDATLDELYPNHGRYVNQIVRGSADLRKERSLLKEDAKKLTQDAVKSDVGK